MSRVIILNNLIRFEPEKKNLSSQNAQVHISAPASYCFQLLIDKQGELVTHEELYQHAWRQFGMEATANTLYQNISVIRRGLDKCGLHEDIIRTMPRRGFILSPAVVIQHARAKKYPDGEDDYENDIEQNTTNLEGMTSQLNFDEAYRDESKTNFVLNGENHSHSQFDADEQSRKFSEVFSQQQHRPEQAGNSFTGNSEHFQSDSKANQTSQNRKQKINEDVWYRNNGAHSIKNIRKSNLKVNFFLILTTISMICSLLYVLVYLNFEPNLESIRYHYVATYNDCNYYLQRDSDNDSRTIDLIFSFSQRCHAHKYKYITKFLEGDMMSVISCSRELHYFSANSCVSEYVMEVGND